MLPHKLPTIVLDAACSREGAGIAEGIAMLIMWSVATIVVVLTVAVISGVVIGRRRGAIARQVRRHLLWSVVGLVGAPIVASVAWMVWVPIETAIIARETAVTEAWIAPLKFARPGELDAALRAVFDAPGASEPGRRIYLIAALPNLLEPADAPLNEAERTALRNAAAQLRHENVERRFGSHPDNLDYVDAAVAWRIDRPDVGAAFATCRGNRGCQHHVLDIARRWCERDLARCAAAFDDAELAGIEEALHDEPSEAEQMRFMRQRLHGGRSGSPRDPVSAAALPQTAQPPVNAQ